MRRRAVVVVLLVVCFILSACGKKNQSNELVETFTNGAKKALENGVGKSVKNISRAEDGGISYYSMYASNLGGKSYKDIYGSLIKEGGNVKEYAIGEFGGDNSIKELLLRCEDKDGYLFETCFCVMSGYDDNGKEDSYIVQLEGQVELKSLNCETYYSGHELYYHDVDVADGNSGILMYASPDTYNASFNVSDMRVGSHSEAEGYVSSYNKITYKNASDLSGLDEVVGRK